MRRNKVKEEDRKAQKEFYHMRESNASCEGAT